MDHLVLVVAGTTDLALRSLPERLRAEVTYADESALVVRTRQPLDSADRLPFANNVFQVLARAPRRDTGSTVTALARRVADADLRSLPRTAAGFRVMVHLDGQLTPVSPQPRKDLESLLSRRLRRPVTSRGSCDEFWVVGRTGLADLLLCARLPKSRRAERARGALSAELSEMLVAASRPDGRDTVLDPFAGSGALILARAQHPHRRLIYNDLDLDGHRAALPRSILRGRAVTLLAEDALSLPSLPDGSVDVVLADPPWGEHADLGMDLDAFADRVLASCGRVLHPRHGRAVILTARRGAAAYAQACEGRGLQVGEQIGILVNGHPAEVLIAGRGADLTGR